MLNDWVWEKIDNYRYIIKDSYGTIIVDLLMTKDSYWLCTFYNNEVELKYRAIFSKDMTIEEIQWKVVLWVYKQCNDIANSFHHIRDHLPNIRNLADAYFLTKL